MSYDTWKTTPPDDPPPTKCECEFDDEGERVSDPCEFCEYQEKAERLEAARDAYWDQKLCEKLGK